jgi:hypothetical protein
VRAVPQGCPGKPLASWPPSSGNPSDEVFTKDFIYEQKPVANVLDYAIDAHRIVSIGDVLATNVFITL